MNEVTDLISNVGFPIFVALYMMYQNQKLSDTIADLKNAITELSTLIRDKEV